MLRTTERIVLVEPDPGKRGVLAERLRSQGYWVDTPASGAEAATLALATPPSVVVADLWMPGISGVQLCRLLRSELATEGVPVILRGPNDTPRQRFWADRAGAAMYVPKGRTGELVRAISRAIATAPARDGFFQIHPDDVDIRDRISQELDAALYRSVLAAEIRSLSTSDTLPRLFDQLSQFLCQVVSYRWLAVVTREPTKLWLHVHPDARERATLEARAALRLGRDVPVQCIEDDDAALQVDGPALLSRELFFGATEVGQVALAPLNVEDEDVALMDLLASELGGPVRIATLVEQTKRLASYDPLTGLMNRRAFAAAVLGETARVDRNPSDLSLLLLDIDHFKSINDMHGHQQGDLVLAAVGKALQTRESDWAGRWGGEEFVVALPDTDVAGAATVAERLRRSIAALSLSTAAGTSVPVTASIGVATRLVGESFDGLVERADRAMYEAKRAGRNRVVASRPAAPTPAVERRSLRPPSSRGGGVSLVA